MSRRINIFGSYSGAAWSPSDLTNLWIWLDANDETTITKDGSDFVSSWIDKSLNSFNFIQSIPANQPTFTASTIGDKPALYGPNNSTELHILGKSSVDLSPYFFIGLVISYNDATTQVFVSDDRYTNNNLPGAGLFIYVTASGMFRMFINDVLVIDYQITISNDYIIGISAEQNGANNVDYHLHLNGVIVYSTINIPKSNLLLRDLQLFRLGINASANEYLAELITTSASITSEDIFNVNTYLNTKYGIY